MAVRHRGDLDAPEFEAETMTRTVCALPFTGPAMLAESGSNNAAVDLIGRAFQDAA
jgi:hypothetical protein